MTQAIRIYVEGGGDSRDQKADLRQGFNAFFATVKAAATDKRIRWDTIVAGSRGRCFDAYCRALEEHPNAFNVLLVDSESPVCGEPLEHLHSRDGWEVTIRQGACHLMAQMMEAWLVADRDALARYYGQGFLDSSIPRNDNVEDIDKADLESALDAATRKTQKGSYKKIRHGAALLARIDPAVVRKKAPHCDSLFQTLESLV